MQRFFFAIGLVFLFPAFVYQLAINQAGEFTPSRVLQIANLSCSIYAVAMIMVSPHAKEIALRCRALMILVGLAFVSTLWSHNSSATFRASTVLLTTTLFGVAMASRLSLIECIQLIVRTMVLGCVLSIIWVVVFPEAAIHQLTDPSQTVHAGLWRGIFSHKQGLGVFAGLTTSLVLFYGTIAFSNPLIRVGAIGCCFACLWGTQSITGLLTAAFFSTTLFLTGWIARRPSGDRKTMMALLAIIILAVYGCFHFGALSFVPSLLGKSADLSGRADQWPWVMAMFRNSGSTLLGGGFMSGFSESIAPGVSTDNGFIDLLIQFGYVGAAVVLSVFGWIIWTNARQIIIAPASYAKLVIFPTNVMFIILFINISETNFLLKHISTVLVAVAVCQIVRWASYLNVGVKADREIAAGRNLKIPTTPLPHSLSRGA